MLEMHLRQPGFMFSDCQSFTSNKKKYKSFKKQEIQDTFIKKD